LGNADCGSTAFADSFRALGTRLFPQYAFRELPADHVIYTFEMYARTYWKTKPSICGLGNGYREMMILIPAADFGRTWQIESLHRDPAPFQFMVELELYASL